MTHPFMKHRGFEEYPFPLSDGFIAELALPRDLTWDDANRLIGFIKALAHERRCSTCGEPSDVLYGGEGIVPVECASCWGQSE
jgi:hypothetical protein